MSYNPQNANGQTTMVNSSPVVLASDQSAINHYLVDVGGVNKAKVGVSGGLAVKGASITVVSGSIAAAGTGTVGPVDVSEAGNVTFIVKNTVAANAFVGNPVIVFEQSDDNVSWAPLTVVNNSTGSAASTHLLQPNTANAETMFDGGAEGVNYVRARVTTGPTTNAMSIAIQAGGMPFSPFVSVMSGSIKPTFRATTATSFLAVAGTAPFFVIQGASTRTLRIQRVIISGPLMTAVGYVTINIAKYSTAVSAGTATALTKIPVDTVFPASTSSLCAVYTAAPTAGTKVGDIDSNRVLAQSTTATAGGLPSDVVFDFRSMGDQYAPVLRGVAEGVGLYFSAAPASAVTLNVTVEWTEEP